MPRTRKVHLGHRPTFRISSSSAAGQQNGWMGATYIAKSLNFGADVTVVGSADRLPIGVEGATIPTVKTEFFDRLGIPEKERIPKLAGTLKLRIR